MGHTWVWEELYPFKRVKNAYVGCECATCDWHFKAIWAFYLNLTRFNVTFSDSLTGLDASSFTVSSFDLDPGVFDSIA